MSISRLGNKNRFGKKHTIETKVKISKKAKKRLKNKEKHPMYRKHHTKESKLKMSKSQKGHNVSEETKIKIGISRKGHKGHWTNKKFDEKHKNNISKALKGKLKGIPKSKEHKRKIGLSNSRDKNANWRGGKSFEPYGLDWTDTLKEAIRQRDNYTCQLCGKTQGKRKSQVHHIDYDKQNNDPKNLIALCLKCHLKTNKNRKKWTKYFKEVNE